MIVIDNECPTRAYKVVVNGTYIRIDGRLKFFDENGRLGRLLSNLPMLKNKFMPLIVDVKVRTQYIQLLSRYKRSVKELDNNTIYLIEENKELYEFFKSQYQNSQMLLDELKK